MCAKYTNCQILLIYSITILFSKNAPKGFASMCLNKQNSEYASGPKYIKILNMVGFSISKSYTVFWICQNMPWQSSEYILGSKCQDSKYGRVLNMQELHRVLNMAQYGWICLNRMWICLNMSGFLIIDSVMSMSCTIHSSVANKDMKLSRTYSSAVSTNKAGGRKFYGLCIALDWLKIRLNNTILLSFSWIHNVLLNISL